MGCKDPSLSIITPAYNRGSLLNNCFISLRNQSNFDFEWIVIDDGSTDDTKRVMKQILEEAVPFSIHYIWKENGGKHTALNESHTYIKGKYVLILDSDDKLTPDAVESVLSGWSKYEDDKQISMVTFIKQNTNGEICAYAKDENVPTDVLRYKRTCVASSDCCEVIRTNLFKKYPFPVFKGEKFLAETALWYRAGLDGSCIYINKVIYICEYLEDGLSKSGRSMRTKNPKGGMYTSLLRMNKRCFMSERIRAGLLYICYGFFADETIRSMISKAKPYQFLAILCLMPGMAMNLIWRKKYK